MVRKPHGYMVIVDPEAPTIEADTLQCCHCQKHWTVQVGSGKQRGFCFKCMGPTCGAKSCETRCLPAEKELELIERQATRSLRLGEYA